MLQSVAEFQVVADYEPAGDQPAAIAELIDGIEAGLSHQTLLGVTGSGKTFTIANVVQAVQRPALILTVPYFKNRRLRGSFDGRRRCRFFKNWERKSASTCVIDGNLSENVVEFFTVSLPKPQNRFVGAILGLFFLCGEFR